ncbi:DUF4065 domain-containing protein [Peptostreptococcaceae bacterium OttesenSCG-928-C18]|nr:DUF4065 domain-containing protein [Peptostreptococcaceae bacterium OttesenSCG-928-C18]
MYKALEVAKYVINKGIEKNTPISNLQLQKILYYMQEYNLKNYNTPLFEDNFEAWQFGPVIATVYHEYSSNGGSKIDRMQNIESKIEVPENMDIMIEEKMKLNPWDLVNDTHSKDKPWYYVYNNRGNKATISKELIKEL